MELEFKNNNWENLGDGYSDVVCKEHIQRLDIVQIEVSRCQDKWSSRCQLAKGYNCRMGNLDKIIGNIVPVDSSPYQKNDDQSI